MCTGSYLSYDSIGAVAPYIKGDLEITGRTYGVLLAVYSLPNVVLCIIGGILTDKFGWQKTSLVFSFFLILGNFIVATSNSSSGLVIGRFVCGLGGESLIVTQTVVLSEVTSLLLQSFTSLYLMQL
jgi:MFS family permease